MKNYISHIAIISLLLSTAPLYAADCQWKETAGEAAVEHITAEEARQLALNRARIKAVEDIAGISIRGSSLVKDFTLAGDFVQAISLGYVTEEKVVGWESHTFQEKADTPPVTVYKVKLKSCVASSQPGDPYFKVKAELNRPVFVSGEEARLKVSCTKDCYITILNLTAENSMRILLPNEYEPSAHIKNGETYNFPPDGLAVEMHPLPGHRKDAEAFFIVATKERFDLLRLTKKKESISPKEFYSAILALPAETWTEEIVVYEVREN